MQEERNEETNAKINTETGADASNNTKSVEELQEMLVRQMREDLDSDWEVTPKNAWKNNHVEFHGVELEYIPSHFKYAAYVEDFEHPFNRGAVDIQGISETICCFISHSPYWQKKEDGYPEQAVDFEEIRGRIMAGLVNYEANREDLQTRPHLKWLDLAVIFYLHPEAFYAEGVPIDNEMAQKWELTADNLLQLSFYNMLRRDQLTLRMVTDCEEYVYDSPEGERYTATRDKDTAKAPMIILSSVYNKSFGATCLLNHLLFSDLAEKLEADLYIYPKSIDEVVISPSEPNEEVRKRIAEEVPDAVTMSEKLSNSIYRYDREAGKISIYEQGEPLR